MKAIVLGLVQRELAKAATNVVIDTINFLADLLKGRDDNSMDKDADVIKELAERNRTSDK
ncbi:conserved hypothetical protein [Vibrio chagasii]|uniref:Uncharacterized protein n=1 Tax=Vibrio crassostreae TaxID=246167 RepID=A0A4R2FT79_9VIBR|nr:hypothetical protein [Vibrio crassostreae]CAH6804578.1 conserved hypothetical protein [Vibrio chagasii]MDH5950453.1 hypothetical protein [Vibrio crassostreae]TCN06104.1 hypothetical protein EDB35_11483 [Vibrio crassostreae]TCN95774.1 hypothetical protein EDB51_11791 [Vibrio crassostreae]TCT41290.1 hypothetical protein EDB29_10383 [Vibrio crassostreae]